MFDDLLPFWCESCLHDKTAFSRAYNNISSVNRALLKKNIAELSKWYNLYNYSNKSEIKSLKWSQNWKTTISKKPADCALVGIPQEFSSPALLLATVMPLKIIGVEKVLVFKCTKDSSIWSDSLLLALELAGVEEVFDFTLEQVESLLQEIGKQKVSVTSVFVNDVDNFPFFSLAYKYAARMDTVSLFSPKSCGIWLDKEVIPDVEAIEFAYPDLDLQFWSQDSEMFKCVPDQYHKQVGKWTDFCESRFDLVFAPSEFHTELLSKFAVVLGQGQEGFWIWPDLHLKRFEKQGLAFSTSSDN